MSADDRKLAIVKAALPLFARKGFDRHDGAVLDKLLIGFLPDNLLDADGSEDLHCSLCDLRGARMDRGSPMMLDCQRADSVMGEQQRSGHSDQTAAHDQYRDLDI